VQVHVSGHATADMVIEIGSRDPGFLQVECAVEPCPIVGAKAGAGLLDFVMLIDDLLLERLASLLPVLRAAQALALSLALRFPVLTKVTLGALLAI
jgi:hypothetical protein